MGNYFNKMSNKVKDESFSIDLPLSNIVLTRYLYLKDEVKLAFLVSLLNKSDDAIFWAYELYYSGYKMEFFDYIWTIYYDFFATLNPSFEQYLNKMLKFDKGNNKKEKEEDTDKLVSAIVQDLLIRPFNTDIFFLRTISRLFEIECSFVTTNIENTVLKSSSILYEQLTIWIDTKDFKSIAQYILNIVVLDTSDKMLYFIYSVAIDVFADVFKVKLSKTKLLKEFGAAQDRLSNFVKKVLYEKKIVLLTKIMTLFSMKEKLVKGKNFYIVVVPEDIIQYETIEVSSVKHYKVLDVARICGIDDLKHLSLFRLERDTLFKKEKKEKENKESQDNTNKLKELYFGNWLYHASFSPVWFDRIRKYRGYVDYTCQKVLFVDEDLMQLFYLKYGYEPDEQSQNTTDKCLKLNDGINWQSFHDKFKANSLFIVDEELIEELNNDKIQYPFYF
jgi:hypothetical protein